MPVKKKIIARGGCFPVDTKINTPSGYRNIQDIKKGDLVYAFTLDTHEPGIRDFPGVVQMRQVTKTFVHSYGEVGYESPLLNISYSARVSDGFADGGGRAVQGTLRVTGNHYILTSSRQSAETDEGFARADELQVGDTLYTELGDAVTIDEITPGDIYDFVYNFEVKEVHTYIAGGIRVHNGGGSKKGAEPATQQPNSIRTNQTIRALFGLSEGEIGGLVGEAGQLLGSEDLAQGVFFEGTRLQNPDGSYNFTKVVIQQRLGTPDQSVIPGFSATEAEKVVGLPLLGQVGSTAPVPIVRTVSDSDIDAARVTIIFPSGLQFVQTSGKFAGSTIGNEVNYKIERRSGSGSWELITNAVVKEMSSGPFTVSHLIPRAGSSGSWDFRVTRLTPESAVNNDVKNTTLQSYTEIQYVNEPYNDRALVAVTVGADITGNRIPTVAFDVAGKLVRIPSNYDPVTRTYSGPWDGSFKPTKYLSDNPAWIVYDLFVEDRYGLGEFVSESQIMKADFYDWAVYNDQLVPDGIGAGTYSPRFTFNGQLMVRADPWQTIQAIAAVANAKIFEHNGYITVGQDRPETPQRIINNSNVLGGRFTYSSTSSDQHTTGCNVVFNDPKDNFLPKTVTENASADQIARFQYNTQDIAAYGASNEGQARRAARWVIDTALNQSTIVDFDVDLTHYGFKPNEVFWLADQNEGLRAMEGRIVAATSNTITIDTPLAIDRTLAPIWEITVYTANAVNSQTYTIQNGTGSHTVLTVTGGTVTAAVGTEYILRGVAAPRQFRLLSLSETNDGGNLVAHAKAVFHDPNKYARIEFGIVVPPPVYYEGPSLTSVNAPTNFVCEISAVVNDDGTISRFLKIHWDAPADRSAVSYQVRWTKDDGPFELKEGLTTPFYIIPFQQPGVYDFYINAINVAGVKSPTLTGTKVIDTLEGDGSLLNPVINLGTKEGGAVFQEDDLSIVFTNPAENANFIGIGVRDFKVTIMDENSNVVRPPFYIAAVGPNETTGFTYTYQDNLNDGGPRRNLLVKVEIRDTGMPPRLTLPVQKLFKNPPPGVPTNINVIGAFGSTKITYTPPRDIDYEGTLIWASSVYPFELNAQTLIFDGVDNYVSHTGLTGGGTYYYVLATYDSFDRNYTGRGLNITAVFSSNPIATDGSKNKLLNSDMEGRQPNFRPTFYEKSGQVSSEYVDRRGWDSPRSFAVRATQDGTGGLGIRTANSETKTAQGVVGGWQQNGKYRISGYVKRENGFNMTDISFFWTRAPLEVVWQKRPTVSVEYQRFDAIITWGGEVEANGALDIRVNGQISASDVVMFDRLQVELGDTLTPWESRLEELTEMQAITVTGVIADENLAAISATKIKGMVTAAQIEGLEASKITGQLTAAQIGDLEAAGITGQINSTQITDGAISTPKLAAGAITTAKLAANAVTADTIAANAITSGKIAAGQITGAKIAAGTILAENIGAGQITTGKLLVTGQGKALNDDPSCVDASAWTYASGNTVSVFEPSCPTGTSVLRSTGPSQYYSKFFPVTAGVRYKVSAWVRKIAGGQPNTLYIRLYCFDPNTAFGNEKSYVVLALAPQVGLEAPPPTQGILEGLTPTGTWVHYVGHITPAPGSARAIVFMHTNWVEPGGVTDVTDIRCEEYIYGDLIVDGTISASKIQAASITATQMAAGSITSNHITAGAIKAGMIEAGSIRATELAANTITGDKIAANTISGDSILSGSVNTNKLYATGAWIKEADIQDLTVTTLKIRNNDISRTALVNGVGAFGGNNAYFVNTTIYVRNAPVKILIIAASDAANVGMQTPPGYELQIRLNGAGNPAGEGYLRNVYVTGYTSGFVQGSGESDTGYTTYGFGSGSSTFTAEIGPGDYDISVWTVGAALNKQLTVIQLLR